MVVERTILADGKEPGGDVVFIQTCEVMMQFDEHVLHDIPCVFEISRKAEGVANEGTFVTLEELGEDVGGIAHAGRFNGLHEWAADFLGRKICQYSFLSQNRPHCGLFCI